jgi:hypothetical protein
MNWDGSNMLQPSNCHLWCRCEVVFYSPRHPSALPLLTVLCSLCTAPSENLKSNCDVEPNPWSVQDSLRIAESWTFENSVPCLCLQVSCPLAGGRSLRTVQHHWCSGRNWKGQSPWPTEAKIELRWRFWGIHQWYTMKCSKYPLWPIPHLSIKKSIKSSI